MLSGLRSLLEKRGLFEPWAYRKLGDNISLLTKIDKSRFGGFDERVQTNRAISARGASGVKTWCTGFGIEEAGRKTK